MYEKVTKKLVNALLSREEGYKILDSLVNRYICRERYDLLPDIDILPEDLDIQCHRDSLKLKLIKDNYTVTERKNIFTFVLSGAFMQTQVYYRKDDPYITDCWYALEADTLDDLLEQLEEMRSEVEEWSQIPNPDEWVAERIRDYEENLIPQMEQSINAWTRSFETYLNISFTIKEDGHHIYFDEIYLSDNDEGELILDNDKNHLYCSKLTSVFTEDTDDVLTADLDDARRGGFTYKKVLAKLLDWLSYDRGHEVLSSLINDYICAECPEILPDPNGYKLIQCYDNSIVFSPESPCIDSGDRGCFSYTLEGYFFQATDLFGPMQNFSEFVAHVQGRKVFGYNSEEGEVSEEEIRKTINNNTGRFSNIILNISFKIMPDGHHIQFDEIYLSYPDHEGDYIVKDGETLYCRKLSSLFTWHGAAERILCADLDDAKDELEKVVSNALSRYSIKDDENVFSRFIRFKASTDENKENMTEAGEARFNLLIKINHEMRVLKCLKSVLQETKVFDLDKSIYILEEDLLSPLNESEKDTRSADINFGRYIFQLFQDYELITIYGCHGRPVSNGTERKEKGIRDYDVTWKYVIEAASQPNAARLIIIANDEVYRKTFRNNSDIFDRVCRNHIEIPDLTEEEVYKLCLKRMENSSFGKLSEDVEEVFHKWFFEIYPRSEIKEEDFIDDLFNNQIFADFFSKDDDSAFITADLIPEGISLPKAEDLFKELDDLVGLRGVKDELLKMYKTRVAQGAGDRNPEHMCFVGNPGTGKTTVAKMVAELLYSMQLIKSDKLVTVKTLDLTSPYMGGTNEQAKKVIRSAYGGVLFIDEAYGLAQKEHSYASEALDALIQEMEDHDNPDRPVVILAGYESEMHDLLAANPGLESRIRRLIHFENYKDDELLHILCMMLEKKGFRLDISDRELKYLSEAGFKLEKLPKKLSGLGGLIKEKKSKEFFGNAREMETLCDNLIEQWANSAYDKIERSDSPRKDKDRLWDEMPKVITKEHIEELKAETKDDIKELIGLEDLKEKLEAYEKRVKYVTELKRNGVSVPAANMHMLFVGNPGTGKTTVARSLADKLAQIGVLPTNKCIIVEAKDLVRYQDGKSPAQITESYIKRAKGGILFIDEAYTLVDPEGLKAIEVLLTAMEEYKKDTIFIFAGYPEEMKWFLKTNQGLQSRIGNRFYFPDYTPEELIEIFYLEMKRTGDKEKTGLKFADDDAAIEKLLKIMEMFSSMPSFGNGRFVESLFKQIIDKRANERGYRSGDREDLCTLTVDDIPSISELLATSFGGDGITDPEKIKDEHLKRVAVHELGHAVVSLAANKDPGVEKISVKGEYGSLGRVTYNREGHILPTEQDYKDELASLLGGRNAERVFYGGSSMGCVSDYSRAKELAHNMVDSYAMGELGITNEMDFLREADARATKILYDNRDFIDEVADKLLELGEMTGDKITSLYRIYQDNGLKTMKAELKKMKGENKKTVTDIKKILQKKHLL